MDEEIIAAHIANLKQLRIQAAKFGAYTPAYIRNEIEDIEQVLINEGIETERIPENASSRVASYLESLPHIIAYLEQINLMIYTLKIELYERKRSDPLFSEYSFGYTEIKFLAADIVTEYREFLSYYRSIRTYMPKNINTLLDRVTEKCIVVMVSPVHYGGYILGIHSKLGEIIGMMQKVVDSQK